MNKGFIKEIIITVSPLIFVVPIALISHLANNHLIGDLTSIQSFFAYLLSMIAGFSLVISIALIFNNLVNYFESINEKMEFFTTFYSIFIIVFFIVSVIFTYNVLN